MATKQDVEKVENQEEVRAPLLQTSRHDKDGSRKENNKMVYLSTFVAVCGSFEFGSCIGFTSPAQFPLSQDLNLSIAQYAFFGSLLTCGAIVGAITCGSIADFFGRKGALRISSCFCIVGWLAIYYAEGPLPLDVGRVATGYGIGIFSYVVPVFIAEIAPKNLRGALTSANQLMIVAGVSIAFVIGTMLSWRNLALTGLIPCGVLLLGLFLVPESPRWLAKVGKDKEFEAALRKLRGSDVDISEEAAEIQDYIETLKSLPKAKLMDLFQRRHLRSVTIGVGLMVFQQCGGINGVCFYTTYIFDSAGFPPDIGTRIYACLQVTVTLLSALFVDKAGRKPLILGSAAGLVLASSLLALSFYFKTHGIELDAAPPLALAGVLLFVGFFSAGMGAVPWVIMSEIFPIDIKGAAGGLITLVNWSGAWLVSFTFNFLMTWSSYGTFIIYAVVNAAAILFVIEMVPETKGRTLEQIQAAIRAH